MLQLSFPFVRQFGRTLAPRVITSIGLPNPYQERYQLGFKFSKKKSGHTKLKRELFGNQTHVNCFYCNKLLNFKCATVEHLIARSYGGTNERSNVAISCGPCNHYRQDYTHEEWKRIIDTGINRSAYIKLYSYLRDSGRLQERRYLR